MTASSDERDGGAGQLGRRLWMATVVLALGALALGARAVELQLFDHGFLASEGDRRTLRDLVSVAHRGTITDRFGEPLAVSTPVDSVAVDPKVVSQSPERLAQLARVLHRDREALARRVTSNMEKRGVFLARHLQPEVAERVRAMNIPGVRLVREYRRYYPAGEVTGHVLGFTSVDDAGQEGLELAYDHYLTGENGVKRVVQDAEERVVEVIESIRPVRPGRDLVLSLDLRIQYLAYRELKRAIQEQHARGGSLVVLDVDTGEVLAMVNQPAFNPNDRSQYRQPHYRNRAVTDMFEPGSSIKPFVLAAALQSGRYRADSIVDTSPGAIRVGAKLIEDRHGGARSNLGPIGLATVLARSSNVGMTMIALSLEPAQVWTTLDALGFGQVSSSGYPGESAGLLSHYSHWRRINIATMSFGYGLSVTPLQLAHAYATLGSGGISRPVTFQRVYDPVPGKRVLNEQNARDLVHLLESVVTPEGTGERAALTGYRVAGKTGTAWKANGGGYSTDKYMSVFAGLVPASHPRLAAAVVIDEPGGNRFYGGDVAAPVFANVMAGALRLMAIAPDDLQQVPQATMARAEAAP